MDHSQLEPMFNPNSVAVFGASDASTGVGARVLANLLAGGFEGPIVPINPKYQTVAGRPCYATLGEVGTDVDLAVIATPARTVPDIIRQCAEAETKTAIVLSAGFGEGAASERRLADALRDTATRSGVRILGPNCVGLVRPWLGLDATFLSSSTPKGGLALISQSGALCSAISDWAEPHHLGFSALVSLGNSLDIDFGDIVQFLATDPKTSAILLYMEGVRDASAFISALRSAVRSKPVVVLKSGRHSQSSKAAHTHTGALIGDDAVFDAALSRAGAVRAKTFGQLFAAAEILSANKRANGNRLGIITNGGGAGVLAADRAGDFSIDLPAPSEKTQDALDKVLPAFWSHGNPIDILGDATPEAYGTAVAAAMADPNSDGVLVMLTPQAMTDATVAAEAVIGAVPKRSRKPLLACWMGETSVAEGRRLLSSAGIPDFTTPERSVEAFSYLAQHHRNRQLALETPGPLSDDDAHDLDGVRMIINSALSEGRSMLSDIESKAVLRAFGIPINITLEAEDAEDALVAAQTVGFPVAMKINSPQITHKSDVGGVRIGIMNAADVKLAYREIVNGAREARPDAEILGVTVEAMAHVEDARELVIGASRDPVFGPAVLFGAGGTMVEVLRDSAVSLPPLNEVLARRLISRTKVSQLLGAFRDRPAVDQDAVIDVLLRVSDIVCEVPEITELDLNPLFAGPDGVIAVDARIGIARPPAKDGPYDHVAIHPYPRHLVSQRHLSDGTPLVIRPIRPEDAESEAAFVRELSPEAKRFRFMGTLNELSPEMLVRFTQIDYRREMALVAVIERDVPEQIGVARYVINPDDTSCEFAIVVSDRVQNKGIGTRLMKALMDAARDHGLTRIEGTVLRNNAPMLDLMDELGFVQSRIPDDPDAVMVERWL
ncbi:MAG: bifunctional acetate--CoA ligase family protein/GNAT family N-acetyltransferase [Rhodobacter sp.]|nr:bifunctional acetate--CoA ligase family protein/GNAT family N-acetyltransferase [Rhodobacter sp.]